ncbi:tryptophan 7-halogenase [Rheinheimera sp. YQF-2]|uniref:Tryptophan 7-halogenase n=1 Tax=Rheinheimera lutimaris TaxID=2740584 RepID=A0A7Y5APH8_9GAMM|nr:tryptophan 7-halogenase [Rheinheimera lutimaris]
MALPDSLAQRIELFRQSGAVFRQQDELFTEVAWQQVMLGQHLRPQHYHPLADSLTDSQLNGFLADLKAIISSTAAQLPLYQQFLQR